jgi:hypothetical protein
VIAPPERKYATWIGGSMLASRPDFASMTVSAAAYAEYGTALLRLPTAAAAQKTLFSSSPHPVHTLAGANTLVHMFY